MYQYFLPEGDLTEASLLQHLQRMAQVAQVKASAVKVSSCSSCGWFGCFDCRHICDLIVLRQEEK